MVLCFFSTIWSIKRQITSTWKIRDTINIHQICRQRFWVVKRRCLLWQISSLEWGYSKSVYYSGWMLMAGTTELLKYCVNVCTSKGWCKASNTLLKSFSYEYCFTGEVLRNNMPMGHTCSPWVNSYKSLSMHFSLLVVMFLPNYPFSCHSNRSNLAFWTKCVYSVEDYSSNISIKLLSTYLQWVRKKGLLSFFPSQVGHLSPPHLYHLPGPALAVLPHHIFVCNIDSGI